ncbi:hypothetical protein CFP56_008476 [Quercus suber]|uniref:Uncharacterized protein n=1 Tax=Quercus suber TaxID=58331 RepID=A0AAW0L2U5_QUESU
MAGHAHAQPHNTPVLQLYCGSMVHASVTTTVLWYAGMKVSLVANAEDSVAVVSALEIVNRCN